MRDGKMPPRERRAEYNINDEDRKFIITLNKSYYVCAKMLGVGIETFNALRSPAGKISAFTLKRVQARINELKAVDRNLIK